MLASCEQVSAPGAGLRIQVEYITEDGLFSIDIVLRPPPTRLHQQVSPVSHARTNARVPCHNTHLRDIRSSKVCAVMINLMRFFDLLISCLSYKPVADRINGLAQIHYASIHNVKGTGE